MKKLIDWIKKMANKILTLLGLKKKVYAKSNSVTEDTVSDSQAGTVDITIKDSDGNTVSKDDNQCVTKGDADRSTSDGVTISGPSGYEENQLIPDATVTKNEKAEMSVKIYWYPSDTSAFYEALKAAIAEAKAASPVPAYSCTFSYSGVLAIETDPNIHSTSSPYTLMISNALMQRIRISDYDVNVFLPDSMLNTSLELTGRKFNCTVKINYSTSMYASSYPSCKYVFQKNGSTVNTVTIKGTEYTYSGTIYPNMTKLSI